MYNSSLQKVIGADLAAGKGVVGADHDAIELVAAHDKVEGVVAAHDKGKAVVSAR